MAMISKEKTKSVIGAIALKIMGWQLIANIILWILFSEFRKYQINRNFSYINKYVARDNVDLILAKESFKIETSISEISYPLLLGSNTSPLFADS